MGFVLAGRVALDDEQVGGSDDSLADRRTGARFELISAEKEAGVSRVCRGDVVTVQEIFGID